MAAGVTDDFWRKIWDDGADNPGERGWMGFQSFSTWIFAEDEGWAWHQVSFLITLPADFLK